MENDLISRQAAIDAINNAFGRETLLIGFVVRSVAVRAISDLPSAQPEIIRCNDCEYYDDGMCRRWKFSHVTAEDSFCCSAGPRLHITGYIPEAWIEDEIEWLRRVGNHFASFAAMNIEAMLKRWREQYESEEDKDGRGR